MSQVYHLIVTHVNMRLIKNLRMAGFHASKMYHPIVKRHRHKKIISGPFFKVWRCKVMENGINIYYPNKGAVLCPVMQTIHILNLYITFSPHCYLLCFGNRCRLCWATSSIHIASFGAWGRQS